MSYIFSILKKTKAVRGKEWWWYSMHTWKRERCMRTMEYISCCNVLLPENGVRSRRSESKSLFLNYSINDDANLLEKPFLTLTLFLKQDFNLWIDSNAVSRWKEAWLLRVAFDPPFGTLLILSYTQFRLHFRVFKTSCFWLLQISMYLVHWIVECRNWHMNKERITRFAIHKEGKSDALRNGWSTQCRRIC